ncbi:MAG: cyclic pyranopterin monophosphate synthase MoaC [Treponema phagedenis]|uniref:cyclic pyranopterin monophosphate synthase MoaC n=1 Tax=Treponema phagedenis TaxID=162 RepID=UPI0001F63D2F|nr:cyclic pyranopterin monophosphate synthase MoaC [Treponema phagedenis]EFW37463.1 molybdenum cofactor biosynthesis protein C [Treponema phagedenis F0421]TYT78283.1 cyclic pyranopterin monophosphate synthase MoaC [Treponema phagedenis]
MNTLTHFDERGNARMVDVSNKSVTKRKAVACGKITMNNNVFEKIKNKEIEKGDVLTVAQVAGIMAAKKTSDLIPMTHPINTEKLALSFELDETEHSVIAVCEAEIYAKTGIEIEVITGVSIALITIYDMVKALDRSMVISDIKLVHKSGGKSGEYNRT